MDDINDSFIKLLHIKFVNEIIFKTTIIIVFRPTWIKANFFLLKMNF